MERGDWELMEREKVDSECIYVCRGKRKETQTSDRGNKNKNKTSFALVRRKATPREQELNQELYLDR